MMKGGFSNGPGWSGKREMILKNNILSTYKQSNELHTAVSVAFSYFLQCRVKTGRKLLLFIVFQLIQQKGEELRDRPIGN